VGGKGYLNFAAEKGCLELGIFNKKRAVTVARAQLRTTGRAVFGALDQYAGLGNNVRLYRAVRESVPVIDAAIMKVIRMTGGLSVDCGDEKATRELAEFLRTVNAGRGKRGIGAFLDEYLDSLLVCGSAVGEIVTRGSRDIAALLCGDVCGVQVKEGVSALDFVICADGGNGIEPLPYQELLLFTPLSPEAGHPYGVSMLRSMPFLAEVLLKIYDAIALNWERAGNLRYSVIYKPQGDSLDRAYAKERAEQIAREWSAAMQSGKNGSIRDFVAVGDVDISVIGADGQILDSETPIRQVLEQLVSKTGIPPFMLGLSWSSTERMSAQQADLMTSEITALRRTLTPMVEKVCGLWLKMHGCAARPEVIWDDINLQDSVEEARAKLYQAQADRAQITDNR
jgi:hypothetical protein